MDKVINLVLSGSGVRVGCHYGALMALKKSGYIIKNMVGVSGGAIIAAAYACNPEFNKLDSVIANIDFDKLLCTKKYKKWYNLFKSNGFYDGNDFENFIDTKITHQLKLIDAPGLNIIAADTCNEKEVVLNYKTYPDMKVSHAVRMSMSVPGFFIPVNFYGDKIVDGGIINNYPIDFFEKDSYPTIGILIYSSEKKRTNIKLYDYFRNILNTMMTAIENEHIEDAYWNKTIKIDTCNIHPFDFDINTVQIRWTIKQGYDTTMAILENKIEKEN